MIETTYALNKKFQPEKLSALNKDATYLQKETIFRVKEFYTFDLFQGNVNLMFLL